MATTYYTLARLNPDGTAYCLADTETWEDAMRHVNNWIRLRPQQHYVIHDSIKHVVHHFQPDGKLWSEAVPYTFCFKPE